MDDKNPQTTLTIHHGEANSLMFRDFGSAGMHVAIFGHHETSAVMMEPADVSKLIDYLCDLPSGNPVILTKYAAELCEREGIAGPFLTAQERGILKTAAKLLTRVVEDKKPKKKRSSISQRALNR
jgi:hypothetical protein